MGGRASGYKRRNGGEGNVSIGRGRSVEKAKLRERERGGGREWEEEQVVMKVGREKGMLVEE